MKPNISHFTWHLSNVDAIISAHIAAIEMGLPLMDPELSINKVTMVSLNSISLSCLYVNGVVGLVIILASRDASKNPSSRSNFQVRFC